MAPIGSEDDFSKDDLEIMEELGISVDPQAGEGDTVDQPSSEQTSYEQPASDQTDQPNADPQGAGADAGTQNTETKTPSADEPRGDLKQALRASRRSERRAKEEADRLKAEADELREQLKQMRATQPKGSTDDDVDLDEIAADFPAAADAIRKERERRVALERENQELKSSAKPAAQQVDPEFQPIEFEADIQDAIDDVPDLLAWQHDPDQTRFQLAVAADGLLQSHPAWRDKPMQERFAEAVRRVKAELSPNSTTTDPAAAPAAQPSKARQAIQNAPRANPETLSDLGGGQTSSTTSNVERYARMSDDDIFADLARGG